MKTNPIVTCIVPTYNNLVYLFETIESIKKQNYNSIELIICDDASSEFEKHIKEIEFDSPNIVNKIVYTNPKNLGTVKNLNQAIRQSTGEYIFFIGGDDLFYDANVISKIVKQFQNSDFSVIVGRTQYFSENQYSLLDLNPNDKDFMKLSKATHSKLFEYLMTRRSIMPGTSTIYKKDILIKYGLFDEKYILIEDYPLNLKMVRNQENIYFSEIITTLYRFGSGVSTTYNSKYLNDLILIFENEIIPYTKHLNWVQKQLVKTRKTYYETVNFVRVKRLVLMLIKHPFGFIYWIIIYKILRKTNL
jgi:glycosyltransferase involved in cell wall biosynthesis